MTSGEAQPTMTGDEVRAWRASFELSASQAAEIVGLSEGAAWRRWERMGVAGPNAVLLRAIEKDHNVRRYFKLA